ncbi:ABC transporter ATP-binding protein [Arenibaculum sp.]|jgi:peptide/nickel transport system ATP-binding protein|uniref:ABC transporter ATP-binding protein n=1 Tax=Arenibaculum sp. TaxID=2865862 RepID=UPI002E0DDCCD|nr:ABC transporter ATP-binding protein [Arenibaculum sp.]
MVPLLDIRNLTLDIPTADGTLRPVRGVDLAVARGETVAIVGESGCGKSLTALAIMGLLPRGARLAADRIALSQQSLIGLSSRQWRSIRGKRIAMIFQDPMTAFDPCYRIGDQIAEILRQHRPASATAGRMAAMLARVGIASPDERLRQYPHQLSGGLRQRVMIATALLCEPDLIIADEPTTALDVTIQAQILRLLVDIQKETGFGLVIITHDLGVVAGVADRVVVMYGGEVVETGTAAAVIGAPRHPYTEGLMRSIPVPGKVGRRAALGFIPGMVPRPDAVRTGCGFLDRCPYADQACGVGAVALRTAPDGRTMRCALPLDGSGRAPDAWTRPITS